MNKKDYDLKIQTFLVSNNFTKLLNDITNTRQRNIRYSVSSCIKVINKYTKRKHIHLNSEAPFTHDTIKSQTNIYAIRLLVNWRNASAYKLAKHLV